MLKKALNIRIAAAVLIIIAAPIAIFAGYFVLMHNAKSWSARGDAALTEGKLDDAIYSYMRANKLSPRLKGINISLCKTLMLDGRGDEAIEAVAREVQTNKNSVDGHILLGYLYLLSATANDSFGAFIIEKLPAVMGFPGMAGKKPVFSSPPEHPLTEALFHFKYAEDLAPHQITAAIGLAVEEGLRGEYSAAKAKFEEILEREPGNAFAQDSLNVLSTISMGGTYEGSPAGASALGTGGIPLPPINTPWEEGSLDGGVEGETSTPTGPPDITQGGGWDSTSPGATANPEDGTIIRPEDLRRDPVTRPIGPINYIPGKPPKPLITIGNRFSAGQVNMSVGQTAQMPKSGVTIQLVGVKGNKVTLLEEGVEYVWVRGKVEWVLQSGGKLGEGSSEKKEGQ